MTASETDELGIGERLDRLEEIAETLEAGDIGLDTANCARRPTRISRRCVPTFQRVYDIPEGPHSFLTAQEFAQQADCSETSARNALEQLTEMGIAERRDGRPAGYRRNDSYVRWKRIESLAREHSPDELRERVDGLIAEDEAFQDRYGVPDPDGVCA